MMDIDAILRERYVSDLRKPEVDNKERAIILKMLCEKNGLSIRELASQFGFKKSTVQDWMLWDDERVDDMQSKGFSDTEIYRVLRNNTPAKEKKKGVKKDVTQALVDIKVKEMTTQIRLFLSQQKYSEETRTLLADLINQCNRLDSFIKRDMSKASIKEK